MMLLDFIILSVSFVCIFGVPTNAQLETAHDSPDCTEVLGKIYNSQARATTYLSRQSRKRRSTERSAVENEYILQASSLIKQLAEPIRVFALTYKAAPANVHSEIRDIMSSIRDDVQHLLTINREYYATSAEHVSIINQAYDEALTVCGGPAQNANPKTTAELIRDVCIRGIENLDFAQLRAVETFKVIKSEAASSHLHQMRSTLNIFGPDPKQYVGRFGQESRAILAENQKLMAIVASLHESAADQSIAALIIAAKHLSARAHFFELQCSNI